MTSISIYTSLNYLECVIIKVFPNLKQKNELSLEGGTTKGRDCKGRGGVGGRGEEGREGKRRGGEEQEG